MAMLGRVCASACIATLLPHYCRATTGLTAATWRWHCPHRQRDRDVTGVLSEIEISPSEARL
jgi:hypothetical protein